MPSTNVDAVLPALAVTVLPLSPNVTLFEFEKTTLLMLAVTRVLPLNPKLMPLLSEKTRVPLVAVWVPAASAPGAVDCE
jgi:hypothetical protein